MKRIRREEKRQGHVLDLIAVLVAFYLIIGLASLGQAASGEEVVYIPFFHAPFCWLAQLLTMSL